MKTSNQSQNQSTSQESHAQDELQAIERLKALGLLWQIPAAFFRKLEIVREVAPEKQPQAQHEWENSYQQINRPRIF